MASNLQRLHLGMSVGSLDRTQWDSEADQSSANAVRTFPFNSRSNILVVQPAQYWHGQRLTHGPGCDPNRSISGKLGKEDDMRLAPTTHDPFEDYSYLAEPKFRGRDETL
jgi:hypothetical protein